MNLSPQPRKTARALLRANRKNGISWRTIEHNGYACEDIKVLPGVSHGTLCRFAKSKGKWIPASIELQRALGIYRERKQSPKMIADKSLDELLYCLQHRTPLIATHTKKAMHEFIQSCKPGRTS